MTVDGITITDLDGRTIHVGVNHPPHTPIVAIGLGHGEPVAILELSPQMAIRLARYLLIAAESDDAARESAP